MFIALVVLVVLVRRELPLPYSLLRVSCSPLDEKDAANILQTTSRLVTWSRSSLSQSSRSTPVLPRWLVTVVVAAADVTLGVVDVAAAVGAVVAEVAVDTLARTLLPWAVLLAGKSRSLQIPQSI